MPKKFDQEARGRVVGLVEDRFLAGGVSISTACQIVAPKLGVSWHTARQWLQQARKTGQVRQAADEVPEFDVELILRQADTLHEPVRGVFESVITDRLREEVLRNG